MCICIAIIYGVCMYVIMLLYLCTYIFYVCIYFISLWQGRTALADCQSIIINQSINQSKYIFRCKLRSFLS